MDLNYQDLRLSLNTRLTKMYSRPEVPINRTWKLIRRIEDNQMQRMCSPTSIICFD